MESCFICAKTTKTQNPCKQPNITTLHDFYPKLTNITNIELKKQDISLLEINPKHKCNRQENIKNVLMSTETASNHVKQRDSQDQIRYN